jgi:hypothetical protein
VRHSQFSRRQKSSSFTPYVNLRMFLNNFYNIRCIHVKTCIYNIILLSKPFQFTLGCCGQSSLEKSKYWGWGVDGAHNTPSGPHEHAPCPEQSSWCDYYDKLRIANEC